MHWTSPLNRHRTSMNEIMKLLIIMMLGVNKILNLKYV